MGWTRELSQDLSANAPETMRLSGRAYRLLWCLCFSQGFQLCVLLRTYGRLYHYSPITKPVARILYNVSTVLFGCHIHPESRIGPGVIFPHPVGIVIGAARIASGVKIYQNVTIGVQEACADQYPTIRDRAILYAGAVVVGGICIGAGSVIGANSVVLKDVPDGATAVGVPARVIERSA